jgi:hypothetical protein
MANGNIVDRNSVDRTNANNPFFGRSPEEIDNIIATLERKEKEMALQNNLNDQIANAMPQESFGARLGRGLLEASQTAADVFLQSGGVSPGSIRRPSTTTSAMQPESELNKLIEREVAKKKVEQLFPEQQTPREKLEEVLLSRVVAQLEGQQDKPGEEGTPTQALPPGTTANIGGISIPVTGKQTAAQEKRQVEKVELAEGLEGLLESFDRAVAEGKESIPAFGKRGIKGRLAGQAAKIKGQLGFSPAIDVFNSQKDAFATTVAKAAGEVRPTDKDIERFVKTLPNPARSDEENALIIADIQKKIQQGNIGDLWTGGSTTTGSKTNKTQGKIKEGATATNPNTGEQIIFRGGKWQKIQ